MWGIIANLQPNTESAILLFALTSSPLDFKENLLFCLIERVADERMPVTANSLQSAFPI